MKLAELERFFAEAATSGCGPRADLEQVFVSDARLSASERLGVYNRGYYYRLLDAISSVFEQTERILGRPELERVALSYLAQHPSQHPAVERVGRLFPEHLRGLSPVSGALADLAALEWARLEALVAPNPAGILAGTSINPAEFPSARLRFVPSLQHLELDVRALHAFAGGDLSAAPSPGPSERCAVAVWRRQHLVLHERLESLESEALRLAAQGASMSRICACFDTGAEAADVRRAFQVLGRWFSRQWLERLDLPET